jgi:hypothetical protein
MRTTYTLILLAYVLLLCFGCKNKIENNVMHETVLTSGKYGHTLNATQVFSQDDSWIFYDTRNEDSHIQSTGTIEKVNVETGEVVKVYTVEKQTAFGPGVGAVACHPYEDKIVFIHGLLNCDEQQPYGFTRRFGAIVDTDKLSFVHAEGRTIKEPLVAGALRGGTHAHTWSGDGKWISFTYNDYLMEMLEKSTKGEAKDLRTIGIMTSAPQVKVSVENSENFSGEYFAVVAATVNEKPEPGSDEIERAFDECWIGNDGYKKVDGTKQNYAVAFQGNVKTAHGALITEVFVADIPEDITQSDKDKPLEGTVTTRPNVPKELKQRRVTFTNDRKHPGLQGPRFRLRSSPDGSELYFLMKDDIGIVQVFSVPTQGGSFRQITNLDSSIQAQFNVSPDGKRLSVVAGNSIWLVDTGNGETVRITERSTDEARPVGGALWSHNGKILVFNRYVKADDKLYLQIVKIDAI